MGITCDDADRYERTEGKPMNDEFGLSRRKLIGAVGTIGSAAALGGASTMAFFSDEEGFANNQLVAGELDLHVGWEEHYSDWSPDEGDGLGGDVTTRNHRIIVFATEPERKHKPEDGDADSTDPTDSNSPTRPGLRSGTTTATIFRKVERPDQRISVVESVNTAQHVETFQFLIREPHSEATRRESDKHANAGYSVSPPSFAARVTRPWTVSSTLDRQFTAVEAGSSASQDGCR
jgi:predicted ribosomally synthesized peptide with SipW-like signal peptide